MSLAVTLNSIEVLLSPCHKEHDAFFEKQIKAFKTNHAGAAQPSDVDAVIIASSSDLTFMACEHSQHLVGKLLEAFPDKQIDIITQGCLGLYASILHFASNPSLKSAMVVMIETPFESLQGGLNASKLGQACGQDGMLANPGVGTYRLQKKAREELSQDDLIVDVAEVIAKEDGFHANAVFLKRIVERVRQLHEEAPARMVSFEIKADLAHLLMKFLQPELDKLDLGEAWLSSYEQDELHVFSLKPLLEIMHYRDQLANQPLITFGLGAGGRLGVLRVTQLKHLVGLLYNHQNIDAESDLMPCKEAVVIDKPTLDLYQRTVAAIETVAPEKAYYKQGKEIMLTLDKAHLGIDNMYFRLPISKEILGKMRPPKTPAMATILAEKTGESHTTMHERLVDVV